MPARSAPYLKAMQKAPPKLRIGFSSSSPLGTPVDAQAVAAVQDAARLLESLGHHVEEAAPHIDGMALSTDFLMAWFCYMAAFVMECRKQGAQWLDFEPDTRLITALGAATPSYELIACEARWNSYTLALSQFHGKYDFWLSPTLSAPPIAVGALRTPESLESIGELARKLGLAKFLRKTSLLQDTVRRNLAWTPYTQLANLTGRPAMSVPLYWTPDGLPLGVQFVGALDSEAMLLRLAGQLEQARPWFERRPTEPFAPESISPQ
jgi:amidase